jgi:5-hydroxyisourate hydrolase-like protein (transthyretin family)
MNKFLVIVLWLGCVSYGNAQDDLMEMLADEVEAEKTPEKVFATFKGTAVINAQTIQTVKKNTLEFNIAHRFGDMDIGNKQGANLGGHTLYGLENAANIRFSLTYGITDKLSVGLGRSKMNEHVDGNLKYRFLEQTENGMPISAAYYANAAISFVANTPENKFVNSMSYVHQLILAKKITRGISLEVLPTYVHRNYVDQTILHPTNDAVDENDLFAVGVAGRIKITKRMAFVFDYFHTFSEFRTADNNFYDAIGVGIEIETGGHVFHINVTNSEGLIANDIITATRSDWGQGAYKLGFNISRVFSF